MNVESFVRRHQITATVTEIGHRTDGMMSDMPIGSRHFRITLRCGQRRLARQWSQGPGVNGEPTAADFLRSLSLDASYVANGQTFDDFCGELGYDMDSREAERIYGACIKIAAGLEHLLGTTDCEHLLWKEGVSGEG